MSYDVMERSRQDGRPATLYLIEFGDQPSNIFAYTDYDSSVTFDGRTFWPQAISASNIESSGSLDNKTLEIEVSPKAGVVSMYRDGVPSHPVRLTMFLGHPDDGEFLPVWTGRIIAVDRSEDGWAKMSCDPIAVSLRRTGLRRHYQYGCPWVLYGQGCGLDKANFAATATVVSHGKNYIDLPVGWQGTFDLLQFVGGFVEYRDRSTGVPQTHTIIDLDSPTRLILSGRSTQVADGETVVTCYLGCQHTIEDCREVFGNVVNFGGQPWIPLENPTQNTNQFQ